MFLQLKRLSREYLHTHLQICLHTNFQYTCKYENRFVDNFYAFTNDYAHTDFECTFLYISTNVGTRLEIYLFFTHLQMRTHTLSHADCCSFPESSGATVWGSVNLSRQRFGKGHEGHWMTKTIQYISIHLYLRTNNIAVFEEMHLCNKRSKWQSWN